MSGTICYAACQKCCWEYSSEQDRETEIRATLHGEFNDGHQVKVNYLGDRK